MNRIKSWQLVVGLTAAGALVGCQGIPSAVSSATVSQAEQAVPSLQSSLSSLSQVAELISTSQSESSATSGSSGTAPYRVSALSTATASVGDGDQLTIDFIGSTASGSATCDTFTTQVVDANNVPVETAAATNCFTPNPNSTLTSGGGSFSRQELVSSSKLRPVGEYDENGSETFALSPLADSGTDTIVFTPAGSTATYTTTRKASAGATGTSGQMAFNMSVSSQLPGSVSLTETMGATASAPTAGTSTPAAAQEEISGNLTTPASGSIGFDLAMATSGTNPDGSPDFTSFSFVLNFTTANNTKFVLNLDKAVADGAEAGTMSGELDDGSGKKLADVTTTVDFAKQTWTGVLTFSDKSTQNVDLGGIITALQAGQSQS